MAKLNSRAKGARGELELSKVLNTYGYVTRRSQQYNGKAEGAQGDLIGLTGVHIECKRVERGNVSNWIAQAVRDAENGDLPAVFHRKNTESWLVTIRLDDFLKLYKVWNA